MDEETRGKMDEKNRFILYWETEQSLPLRPGTVLIQVFTWMNLYLISFKQLHYCVSFNVPHDWIINITSLHDSLAESVGITQVTIGVCVCVCPKMKWKYCNASVTVAYHPAILHFSNTGCAVVSAEEHKLCFFVAMDVTVSPDCKWWMLDVCQITLWHVPCILDICEVWHIDGK